jgi:hypothetical protein
MKTMPIAISLLVFLGLQSCTIYNRIPTPIDQAANKGKVKMVQKQIGKTSSPITVTTEYKNIFLLKDKVAYGGLKKNNTIEPLLYDAEKTTFYIKNKKKSITATVLLSVLGGAAATAIVLEAFYLLMTAMWY